MDERRLRKYVGTIQQLAYAREITYQEGRAKGMNAVEVCCGQMTYTVMADKCLDISELRYKGINISFISKPGLTGRCHYDTNGAEAQRSIMGGLFFTCGYENICPPCTDEGVNYPMHGRMRTTPAEHLCSDAYWEGDKYHIVVSGEMREAELFGENMQLRREIKSVYGEKTIYLKDEITNCAFREEPMLLLYHFNMGFPLLDKSAELVLPSKEVTPRDMLSDAANWSTMSEPIDNLPEQVFTHKLATDEAGNTFCAFINPDLNIGFMLEFNTEFLPKFMEWKSMASGDYVLGMEMANSNVLGRLEQKKEGLPKLSPGERRIISIKGTILDGIDEIKNVKEKAKLLIEGDKS